MSTVKLFFKQLFCKHDYVYVGTFKPYGVHHKVLKSVCSKCGRPYFTEVELYGEEDREW